MRHPKIEDAKRVARECDVDGVVLVAIAGRKFSVTSYGKTKELCGAFGRMADQIHRLMSNGTITPLAVTETKPKAKPPIRLGGNEEVFDWEDAVEQANRIISMCEELPDAGTDFGISVTEKCEEIAANIEEHRRCTQGQQEALDNMESGVWRWFHD